MTDSPPAPQPVCWEALPLLGHHIESLKASAISVEVAMERGYKSITRPKELLGLKYSRAVQALVPGLLIPQHIVTGKPFEDVYRPDTPRQDDRGKDRKYEYRHRQQMVLDVAPRMVKAVLDATTTLWITEGVKKGDALASCAIPAVALGGVWNWATKKDPETGKQAPLPDWETVPLAGRQVVVAYDSDVMVKPAVYGALVRLSKFLTQRGATVRYCYLPSAEDGGKVGLDDYLAAGHSVEELLGLVTDELRELPDAWGRRYSIAIGFDPPPRMKDVALEALVEVNRPPTLYSVGGKLARVQCDDEASRIVLLAKPMLRDKLDRLVAWRKFRSDAVTEEPTPSTVVEDLLDLPDHAGRFPVLTQVVTTPFFAHDGTLVLEPGYSKAAGVFYDPRGLVVPSLPTLEAALDLVMAELLGDFPFASQADRANALALYLLPMARPLISGATPPHLAGAPTPGTGKGLLVDMLLHPAFAGMVPRTTECKDDDEWRKRITALLAAGRQVVLIDNVNRLLDSGVLAGALTAPVWEDRVLGHTRTVVVPNRAIWVITANNVVLSTEMARRMVYIWLDAHVERPWEITGYRHPDLRGWAAEHRGELVAAGLAIIQAWVDAGRPLAEVAFGDYRSWATTMGGILQVAGFEGFLANATDRFEAAADELDELRLFVGQWWAQHQDRPVKVADLMQMGSLWSVGPGLDEKKDRTTAFGMWLKKQGDKVVMVESGVGTTVTVRVTKDRTDRLGAKYYRLLPVPTTDPDQGFRVKSPAQTPSAEPRGTLPNPQARVEKLDIVDARTTGEGSSQGSAGLREPSPTRPFGAEPLSSGATNTPDVDPDEWVEVEL